jgi:hypothetical protein
MGSTDVRLHRNEASKPMMSIIKKVENQNTVSSKINNDYIEFEDSEKSTAFNKYKFEKINKFYIKNEQELDKMGMKIKHTISGKTSLKEHGDKKIITSIKPEDK